MNTAFAQKIDAVIESLTPELVAYSKQLISFPTVAGQEQGAQEYLRTMLEERGFAVDMWEPDIQAMREFFPFFRGSRESFAGSPNVVGVRKGTGGGRSLMVNGHIDVVPPGERSAWNTDPFTGVLEGDRLYGRGISDMKIAHAAFRTCVDALEKLGVQLKGDLILESVVDEETGGAGTLAAIMCGYQADGAVIPEPTGMVACTSSPGVSYFKVKVKGRAFHGGTRYKGVSAIEKAMEVVTALQELEADRTMRLHHPLFPALIPFTINIGTIQGGAWPSMVPDEVVMEGRFGISPRETLESARAEFEKALAALAEEDPWFQEAPVEVEWTNNFLLPGESDPDHALVRVAAEHFRTVTGREMEIGGCGAGTDGGALMTFGKTPAIVFGPGHTAHCANEYIEISEAKRFAKILLAVIIDWCGMEESEDL